MKIAELQANANAKRAEVEKEADVKIAELQAKRVEVEMKAQVKIAKLQVRRAPEDAKMAQSKAKEAEWGAKATIFQSRTQLLDKKREREETTESTMTTPTKVTKQSKPPKPSLAERLAAHNQTYKGAMSFSHVVYERMQDLAGCNIDIVTAFQRVQEWFKRGKHQGYHCHGPRDMESVMIVYIKTCCDDKVQEVAINCLENMPMSHYQPVVVAPFKAVSLLSAAVHNLPEDQIITAANILINEFVYSQHMKPWHGVTCFIMQDSVTQEIDDITTYVDITHPMVTTLRDWLRARTVEGRKAGAPMWSSVVLPPHVYPESAGLGPFNRQEAHTLLTRYTTVNSWLMEPKHMELLWNGYQVCDSLSHAVHPDQTVFVFCPTFKEQPDVDRAQYWMNVVQPHIPSVTFSQLVQIFDWNIVK